MNDNTFHQRSSLNFTLLHFTTIHSQFFTSIFSWMFHHHASKTLHFSSLVITFPTLFLKICDLQGKNYFHVYPGSLVQGISYVLANSEEAAGSAEALVNLYETAWCHIQKLVIFVQSARISVTRCHILQNILRCDMRM